MVNTVLRATGLVLVVIGLIFTGGCTGEPETKEEDFTAQSSAPQPEKPQEPLQPPHLEEPEQPEPELPAWKYGGVAVAGRYADAEVVDLGNERYRMYYSAEPEVPGFEGQVYSAVSPDGVSWISEEGIRMKWSTFPSVVTLPNGSYRMYYQDQGVIKSALSSDGLSWSREQGVRVDTASPEGLQLDNVGSPTVMRVNESYVKVYRGTINQRYPYPDKLPNDNTQLFLWASSRDGLLFEKKGIALDSRNEKFKGFLDGPDLVKWSDGSLRLYFCSYQGVFHTVFKGGEFSDAKFDYTTASDPKNPFPPNPPSDPTLMKIGSKWFMYYGQHTKGIYYARLE